jgi:hypothetical protein
VRRKDCVCTVHIHQLAIQPTILSPRDKYPAHVVGLFHWQIQIDILNSTTPSKSPFTDRTGIPPSILWQHSSNGNCITDREPINTIRGRLFAQAKRVVCCLILASNAADWILDGLSHSLGRVTHFARRVVDGLTSTRSCVPHGLTRVANSVAQGISQTSDCLACGIANSLEEIT